MRLKRSKLISVILFISSALLATPFAYAGQLLVSPKFYAADSAGAPLSGGLLYAYVPGTTTAKATYSDAALTTANAHPVVLDSRGEAIVYLSGPTKLKLTTSAGVEVWAPTQAFDGIVQSSGSTPYLVDAAESDQGAAGSGRSVKDIVDAVTTSFATMVFDHTSSSANTDYVFGTSETIGSSIVLDIRNGARLSIASGKTLTIYSPENIIAQPNQQIFTGSGTIAFTKGGTVYPDWWGANSTPGTTDMTAEIGAAYTALQGTNGCGIVKLLPATYAVADLSFAKNDNQEGLNIEGSGRATTIVPASGHTSGNPIITLAGTHAAATKWITIADLIIDGNNTVLGGIKIEPSSNCRLRDVTILDCDGTALETQRAYDLYCTRVRVYNCGYQTGSKPAVKHTIETGGKGFNQIYWTDCNIELFNDYGLWLGIGSNFQATGGKIHGIAIADAATTTDLDANLYIDGATARFANMAFAKGRASRVVHIVDDSGVSAGSGSRSRVMITNCEFLENGATAEGDNYVFELDTGRINSRLVLQGNIFADALTSTGRIIKIGANVHNYTLNNWHAFNSYQYENSWVWARNVEDDRTAQGYRELVEIRVRVSCSGGAKGYTVWQIPTGCSFMPIMVQARADTAITGVNTEYIGIGPNTNNRRVDFGTLPNAFASTTMAANDKMIWINHPSLTNTPQVMESDEYIRVQSVADTTDAAALGSNFGGTGEYITVVIKGWLLGNLPNL